MKSEQIMFETTTHSSFNDTDTEMPVDSFKDTGMLVDVVITDEVRNVLEPILWFIMFPFNVMGIITNMINIRVFLEQGVRNDSTTIGFVCLSVWDLITCATLVPYSTCFILRFSMGFHYQYQCIGSVERLVYAHKAFQHIGAWTTVYISLIRCFCVIFPLRVKFMFSPKITIIYMAVIFVFFLGVQIVSGLFTDIVWKFLPLLNMSVPVLVDKKQSRDYLYYKLLVINQILPAIAIVIVSINTALLGRKLLEVKKWRLENSSESSHHPTKKAVEEGDTNTTTNTKSKALASKEIELIKFINTVTSIFLVCVLMSFIPSVAMMSVPGVSMTGVNKNLFFISFWIRFVFDAVNSSINFFFYIRVSTRYKTAFASAFKTCSRAEGIKT